jgi:hypothetical protein
LIFDCWSVHKTTEWIEACKKSGFEVVFIPAGFTDYLQPMDLAVNKVFKDNLKNLFDEYLVSQLSEKYNNGDTTELPVTLPELKSKIVEWADISHTKIVLEVKAVKLGNFLNKFQLMKRLYFFWNIECLGQESSRKSKEKRGRIIY